MPTKPRYTKSVVAKAIRKRKGMLYLAAYDLEMTYHGLRKYMIRWPELKLVRKEAIGRYLDVAESQLFQAVKDGDLGAIKWLLSTRGAKRGYVKVTELNTVDKTRSVRDVALQDILNKLSLNAKREILAAMRSDNRPHTLIEHEAIHVEAQIVDAGESPASGT